jgi:hypothetical protein
MQEGRDRDSGEAVESGLDVGLPNGAIGRGELLEVRVGVSDGTAC